MVVNTAQIKVTLYPLTIAQFLSVSAHNIIKWTPRQAEPLKPESFSYRFGFIMMGKHNVPIS